MTSAKNGNLKKKTKDSFACLSMVLEEWKRLFLRLFVLSVWLLHAESTHEMLKLCRFNLYKLL